MDLTVCWQRVSIRRGAHVAMASNDMPAGKAGKIPMAILVAAALLGGGFGASEWLKPTRVMADEMAPIEMSALVPKQFGEWRAVEGGPAVVQDPTIEATVKLFYSQTLSRTYVNAKGMPIMLSVAYGRNQNSFNTAAHRPEFCYRAQGFEVADRGVNMLGLDGHEIVTRRLAATSQRILEPITYWVTLDDSVTLPGFRRRMEQMKFGLQGKIVDGFLFRISSYGGTEAEQFERHAQFARDLEKALPEQYRVRLFGSK